jgi:hypothetical protein
MTMLEDFLTGRHCGLFGWKSRVWVGVTSGEASCSVTAGYASLTHGQ